MVRCEVCPYYCELREGQTGRCRVRSVKGGKVVYDLYAKVFPVFVAPSETQFMQFMPGTKALSIGSLGCNLSCRMCHNSAMTQTLRTNYQQLRSLKPEDVPQFARRHQCQSVLFTFNDPVPQVEYVRDVFQAAREAGLKTSMATAGHVADEYRYRLFELCDAVELSLKGYSCYTHQRMTRATGTHARASLEYLALDPDVWLEVTMTIVPGINDRPSEYRQFIDWYLDAVGPDVPLRLARFKPANELLNVPHTEEDDLGHMYQHAVVSGLKYVYLGNVASVPHQTTYCPNCGEPLIQREWYELMKYKLKGSKCFKCGTNVDGVFSPDPPRQAITKKYQVHQELELCS